ncbi:flagellar biosynthesis protein FlhF [Christensenellaceae bacterium OttesenSCG-928-M15]|nr:flagellar biosynthesis protein FlhF [Christensenellaceae bacterium OttesenSCG-928-M15]
METKTYYGKDLSEILEQIKQELGPDAIIVKSRKTKKKGLLGVFQKPIYEVVVNYDPEDVRKNLLAPPNLTIDKAHEKSPLSDFGKEAERRLPLSAPKKPSKQQAEAPPAASNKRQQPLLVEEPEVDPDSFAELMELVNTPDDDYTPAWGATSSSKVSAYVTMRQSGSPAATKTGDAPSHLSELLPSDRELSPSERRAQELIRAMEAEQKKQDAPPPEKPSPHMPGTNVHIPVKRKRGRPRKHPLPGAQPAPIIMDTDMLASSKVQEPPTATGQGSHLISRLDVVEEMLRSLMGEMQKPETGAAAPVAAKSYGNVKAPGNEGDEMAEINRYKESLMRQDVDFSVVDALMAIAVTYKKHNGMTLHNALERALREVLGRPRYLRGSTKTARTVMLIGPTGVGKTTTLVKLAAGCMFERKANVAIINADVFRVGAQDQLNAYAKILDVPLKTIYETHELKPAIESFADKDFVFIDTCGKASDDKDYQNEIKELLKSGKVQDVYLVVSSTTSGRVCRQIVESYGFIKQYKTILTKIDESGSLGGAVNLCYYSGQPLSYVTIGQNVPDDISKVDVETVVSQLMR